ncbi:MAG: hypothetical protein VXV96_05625 [Bdellovibrionota bacterium]|nr:hypothetical protein [Bdellovibrionota bacterium]
MKEEVILKDLIKAKFEKPDLENLKYIHYKCFDEYSDWLDADWYWTVDHLVEKYGGDAIHNFFKNDLTEASQEHRGTLLPYLCFIGVDSLIPELIEHLKTETHERVCLDGYAALVCRGRREFTDKFMEYRDFWINKGWGKFHHDHIYPILDHKLAHDPEFLKKLKT